MKILIVSSYFGKSITGALQFVKQLSDGLASHGHEVSIALDIRYKTVYNSTGSNIQWFSSLPFIGYYSPSLSFLKILGSSRYDVVHINGYMSFQADFGALACYLRRTPVILTPHGSLLGYKHLSNRALDNVPYILHEAFTFKLSARLARYVIVTSSAEYSDALRYGISEEKVKLIPLPYERPKINSSEQSPSGVKKLLFVGRLVPNKNIEIMLHALSKIRKSCNNKVELLIVGDEIHGRVIGDKGYKERLIELTKELDLEFNVKFLGWHIGESLWKIYDSSDIFLCASTYENFCLPILEAASFGKPIISTDVGCARDIIGSNKGGFIIKRDSLEMADAVLKLLRDSEYYDKAGKSALLSSKNYSISHISTLYEEIFNTIKR